jgi:hypothetical protein
MVICKYCSKIFRTTSNLYMHQRNTRYCLQKQEELKKNIERKKEEFERNKESNKCSGCNKTFTTISNLNRHKKTCTDIIIINTKNGLAEQNDKQVENIKEQCDQRIKDIKEQCDKQIENIKEQCDKQIENIKEQCEKRINDLKEQYEQRITELTSSKKSNNLYSNIDFDIIPPLTNEWIIEKANMLTVYHMNINEIGGFIGKYLMENIFVTDRVRHKVVYVNENRQPVVDCTIENILTVLLAPIELQISTVADEAYKHCEELEKKQQSLKQDISIILDKKINIRMLKTTLRKIAKNEILGEKYIKIQSQIVSVICKTAKGKQQLYEITNIDKEEE